MIDLEELLGRPVDIAIVKGLKPQLREHILKQAVPL
jgi:predicted nucleotidyltransferase